MNRDELVRDRTSFWRELFAGEVKGAFEALGTNPFLWVVCAMGPVGAGVLASLHPVEIRDSVPLFLGQEFSWIGTSFWALVIVSSICFALGQWSQSRGRAKTRRMVARLGTLPPGGFLASYREMYNVAADQAILALLNTETTFTQNEAAIRNVLGAIAEIAKDFDEADGAVYGANVMLFRKTGEPFEAKTPEHLTTYVPCSPDVDGYLELITSLSTNTAHKSKGYSLDPATRSLVIPIPIKREKIRDITGHSRDPVLPGAAQAYARGEMVVFSSIDSYVAWIDTNSAQDLATNGKLKDYFETGAGKEIRSFCAQPIMYADSDGVRRPLAVLNVHSNDEHLLENSGPALFSPLIEPFCVLVATLLIQRKLLVPSN